MPNRSKTHTHTYLQGLLLVTQRIVYARDAQQERWVPRVRLRLHASTHVRSVVMQETGGAGAVCTVECAAVMQRMAHACWRPASARGFPGIRNTMSNICDACTAPPAARRCTAPARCWAGPAAGTPCTAPAPWSPSPAWGNSQMGEHSVSMAMNEMNMMAFQQHGTAWPGQHH